MKNTKVLKNKIRKETEDIGKEIQEKTLSYILAAFGLIAALAWNDAIKGLIEYFFPLEQNTVLIKCLYAFLITLIVVVISTYITKLFGNNNEN
jgi:cadmium resistance protein CadD (predicted permease)